MELAKWVECIVQQPGRYRKLFETVFMESECNTPTLFWPKAKANANHAEGPEFDLDLTTFTCETCGYHCSTIQGLNWHCYEAHGEKAPYTV